MHIHVLGICGTFMGGIAALAVAAGHRVTGSDRNVYPPMSTQLRRLGIDVLEGFDEAQLEPAPDCVVVGNAMTRGNPAVEAMLERGLGYCSGPEWLARHVLRDRHVLAVAGTHGKTTTASMLAWILEDAGLDPGFLIGGVPANFDVTARLGSTQWFVVEADEYDTAFFDKRAKFVHYRPSTVVLNNLEYDHADIYPDLDTIVRQFHHLVRIVPRNGRIIANAADANLEKVLAMGCWTPLERFGIDGAGDWRGRFLDSQERRIAIAGPTGASAQAAWTLSGAHNLENAVAATAAAVSAGVSIEQAVDALSRFDGVQRRMQRTATVGGIAVYDDFAHHPTAIRRSLAGLKQRFPGERIIVALEPRSNTMKLGVHNDTLAASLAGADLVFVFRPPELDAQFDAALAALGERLHLCGDYDALVAAVAGAVRAGDHVVFMSNGGFGGARQKLTAAVRGRAGTTTA
jgi:UDP-N-acetylmuramate: L-alanyl-gamma-D-glutamyl-meso-diaminopimelate ligase